MLYESEEARIATHWSGPVSDKAIHVVCQEDHNCPAYDIEPTKGGFYSSRVDFCETCGSSYVKRFNQAGEELE